MCNRYGLILWGANWLVDGDFLGILLSEKAISIGKTDGSAIGRHSIRSLWVLWFSGVGSAGERLYWWGWKQYFNGRNAIGDYDSSKYH